MVEPEGCALSVRRQCELLAVNRNRLEGPGRSGVGTKDLEMARRIDEIHLRFPEFGTRRTSQYLLREGWEHDYHSSPAVHDIACVGTIESYEELEESRPAR